MKNQYERIIKSRYMPAKRMDKYNSWLAERGIMGKDGLMQFNEIKERLMLEEVPEYWENTWEASKKSMPEKELLFLEEEWLLGVNSILKLPEGAMEALLGMAHIVRKDSILISFAQHCRYLFFEAELTKNPWSFAFPSLNRYFGEDETLFYILILISRTDSLLKSNEARGIPMDVTVHTLSDLKLWMGDYFQKHGRWGLDKGIILWHIFHFSGRIYRLGRLQFAFWTCSLDIIVYRNKRDGDVVALSTPGVKFRDDGQVDGTNDIYDKEHGWQSVLKIEGGYISGNPISPHGFAIREKTKLKEDEWEQILTKGDRVLDIHIPGDGRLEHVECIKSMQWAKEFFSKYFPEGSYSAMICTSWLLDPQYQKLLPVSSNIVKFQREFYLVPVFAHDYQTLSRVFGGPVNDPEAAQRDTQLRRAILDHMAIGGHMRDTGGFILMDFGLEDRKKEEESGE